MRSSKGQIMLLSVILIASAVLTSTSLAGLLVLYQLRQAADAKSSAQAIFAADSGMEWAFFNETRAPSARQTYPYRLTLSNGSRATVIKDPADPYPLKSIGQAGRSARAFQSSLPSSIR